MSTGISISCCNCTLLIKLLLQLLVFVVHVFSKATAMVFDLPRADLLEIESFPLVLRFYMTVASCRVRHAAQKAGTSTSRLPPM